ncbi:MAG: polysaccharide deacetylase family protein [Firmicutes bacterium]|nr:polysaccharide deacetylase family protein [Bacillota bacterium]
MKKTMFWIFISAVVFTGAYYLSGMICDAVSASAEEERLIPIYSVETDEKCVALTFDAAWGNEDTQILLDILKENKVPATFFVTGQWADKFPEDVKKFYEAGHDIANHSYSHPHIADLSYEELKEDTLSCNEKIKSITGESPLLYRGPYGEYSNTLIEMLHDSEMYYTQWDVDSLDWKDPNTETLVKNVTKKVQNGSIVLLHNGAKNTPAALPDIIKALKDDGYKFVLVKDMIYKTDYTTDHAGRQLKN